MSNKSSLTKQNSQKQPNKSLAIQSIYSGPIPSPETFSRYEATLPGSASRILAMAESEASHRQAAEMTVIEGNISANEQRHREVTKGQWFAFFMTMMAFSLSAYALSLGKENTAVMLCGGTILGLATAFIGDRVASRASRKSLPE